MLFLVHFEITPRARDKVLERLKASGKWEPAGVKTIAGSWLSVTQLEGWGVVWGWSRLRCDCSGAIDAWRITRRVRL
jgi:uncharacterized protein DUF3303